MKSRHIPLWVRFALVGSLVGFSWLSDMIRDPIAPAIHPHLSSPVGHFWYEVGNYRRAAIAYKADLRRLFDGGETTGDGALDAFLKGDVANAKALLQQESGAKPWTPAARLLAGRIALEENDPSHALMEFAQVLTDDPRNHQALILSAVAHTRLGNERQAIDGFKHGLRADAEGTWAIPIETLLETAGELTDRPKESRPFALLAHYYRHLRILDDRNGSLAIKTAHQAIERGEFADEAFLTIGVIHYKHNRLDEAMDAFQQAVAANPKNADACYYAALGYSHRGDLAKEYQLVKQAAEAEPDDGFYAKRFSTVVTDKLGDLYQALDIAHHALDRAPNDARLLAQVGRVYQELGEWKRAHEYYQRAIELAPKEVAYRDMLAYALVSIGRMEQGMALYREILRLQPQDVDARIGLAIALVQTHQYKEALQEYEQAAKLGARSLSFQVGFCSLLWRTADFYRAKSCYLDLLRMDPGNVFANRNLPYVMANLNNGAP